MYAVRNIRLCTKDCLCLYVCPTGATDTENSVIDRATCIGCGACANACPSGAITMAPETYPPQQKKRAEVVETMRALAQSKLEQENAARALSKNAAGAEAAFFAAIVKSNRTMAEDILREAGFMLPQSANARRLLESLLADAPEGFPREAAQELLDRIKPNDGPEAV